MAEAFLPKQTTYHEPWTNVVEDVFASALYEVKDCDGITVMNNTDEEGYAPTVANAARIVACVNACAGMRDPEREIYILKEHHGF